MQVLIVLIVIIIIIIIIIEPLFAYLCGYKITLLHNDMYDMCDWHFTHDKQSITETLLCYNSSFNKYAMLYTVGLQCSIDTEVVLPHRSSDAERIGGGLWPSLEILRPISKTSSIACCTVLVCLIKLADEKKKRKIVERSFRRAMHMPWSSLSSRTCVNACPKFTAVQFDEQLCNDWYYDTLYSLVEPRDMSTSKRLKRNTQTYI